MGCLVRSSGRNGGELISPCFNRNFSAPEHLTSTRTLSVGTISTWQRRTTNVAIDIQGHRTAEAQLYMSGAVDDGESIHTA